MEKLIIENQTEIPLSELMVYIEHVLQQGKISKGRFGMQYCFANSWKNGISICAYQNKSSDRLVICKNTITDWS